MFANYFAVALRNLLKNKFLSAINISGLALGLACVVLITVYLKQELAYDSFHDGAGDIYRVIWSDANPQTRTPHPMAQALKQDFPEVREAVSITPLWGAGLIRETFSFSNPEKDARFDERNVMAVDTTFFKVFTFPLLKGNPLTVLKNTGGLLISESMSKKYFGTDDPMGKHLAVNNENELIEVVGVFKDVPSSSHFHFDFLVSYLREKAGEDSTSQYYTWNDFGHYNYIRLNPGTDAKVLEDKIQTWIRKYISISDERFSGMRARNYGFRLQPIKDIHLQSHVRWELEPNGYIAYIYMMSAAALLILFIGCINFINLTTAQSAERLKEIGIRKALGAYRRQLAIQFTGESMLVCLVASLVGGILIEFAAPYFTSVTGRPVDISYGPAILFLGGLGIATGILAGAFPSTYISAGEPGLILKGKVASGKGSSLRSGFTLFQFLASMVLISCSAIIYTQLDFIQSRDLGFEKEQVVVIPVKARYAITPRMEALRTELLKVPGVKGVSASSNVPGRSYNQNPVFASSDPANRIAASESMVDFDYFDVMNIQLADGRLFQRNNPADRDGFILNEAAARALYSGQAVGKEFSWDFDEAFIKGPVIGVVKDFHYQSLHQSVQPLLFRLMARYNYVLIKLNTSNFRATMEGVQSTWRNFDNQFEFEFSFLSDDMNQLYSQEQNMASVLTTFSGIAILIACFGLLGIAALTFRRRTKEVSVRKVLGATRLSLMFLLVRDFTRIVLAAVAIAVPLVWWMMSRWLENFTFRVDVNPLILAAAGLFLLFLAWATLGYLTWNVSKVNPAETLKSE